jgi:hypothetical protein
MVATDLDDDGTPDFVAGILVPSPGLHVHWGADFGLSDPYPTTGNPSKIVLADLSGNGRTDVVARSGGTVDLFILENLGDRSFRQHAHTPQWWSATGLDAGDVDGDGDTDLVGSSAGLVIVYENLLIP